jgi:citrate lyase beta subunit
MMKTLLYWPGTKIVDPARWGGIVPDLLVIDLEESVAMPDRPAARTNLIVQCRKLASVNTMVAVRLCEASGPAAEQDLLAITLLPKDIGIVIPKPVTAAAIARMPSDRPLWLMAEQPGIAKELPTLCRAGLIEGFIIGLKDMCEALGVDVSSTHPRYRNECEAIVHAAHQMSKPVFSGVLLYDEQAIVAGQDDARSLGFDGVSLINARYLRHLQQINVRAGA